MKKTKLGIGTYAYFFASTETDRIGIANLGFSANEPWTVRRFIDRAVELGVHHVQLADNYNLDQYSEADLISFGDYATKKGVRLETGMRGLMPDQLDRYLAISQKMNASMVRCVIDNGPFKPGFDEIDQIVRRILPELEKSNLVLGIENHDRFTADQFAEIVKRIDSPRVGIIIDTVNSFSNMETTEKIMETLSPYAVGLHIKDYIIERRKDARGLVINGTPAGYGRLDIPYVFDMMKRNARMDFSTILEFWMEPEDDLEKTLRKENEWVEQSIAYLRAFED